VARKPKNNLLEFVPERVEKHEWSEDENGKVTVHMVHDGWPDRIAQRLFHRPRVSHIDLDGTGGFVWRQIDGKRTVGEIALLVKEQFGEQAEPLYGRLAQYMRILRNNGLVRYVKGN